MGKKVSTFESKSQNYFQKYGLMVNSGSSALLLALKVMNLKGSEIIVPCLNFGTAISSITGDLVQFLLTVELTLCRLM